MGGAGTTFWSAGGRGLASGEVMGVTGSEMVDRGLAAGGESGRASRGLAGLIRGCLGGKPRFASLS